MFGFPAPAQLYVADTVIANATSNAIIVQPNGSGGAKVMLDRVRVENGSDNGIIFEGSVTTGSISATVRDSVVAGNGGPASSPMGAPQARPR